MDRGSNQGLSLEAHADELGRRRAAIESLQGGPPYHWQEVRLFERYADEVGLWLEGPPRELRVQPDFEGNEHQVWFDAASAEFLKITWGGFFGLKVVHRADEDGLCSPIDYFSRWKLHNRHFGDRVRFVGAFRSDAGIRLMLRQPAVEGVPATVEEIAAFFISNGWRRFVVAGEVAFFDATHRLAISDTHPGNLVKMADGLLAPIDLRVQALSDTLVDAVAALCDGDGF